MSERNKFELMDVEKLQLRMLHHVEQGALASLEGRTRAMNAHTGWYRRLDQIHFRKLGLYGRDTITADFVERHKLSA